MNTLLPLLTGSLIAVMVMVNGTLAASVGSNLSAVMIYLIGAASAALVCKLRRQTIFCRRGVPFWVYLGGAIGVLATFANNYSYGKLSMTGIVALGLLGQSVTSVIFDAFGLCGLQKRRLGRSTGIGLAVSGLGVLIMLRSSSDAALLAVLLSIASGVSLVVSRVVNARLSARSDPMVSAFYVHLSGLPCCLLIWLLFSDRLAVRSLRTPWMLLGGVIGVAVVWLYNLVVPRVSSVRVTLLSFLGQLFTGFGIDLLTGQAISGPLFWGGVLCAAGFSVSMLLEFAEKRRAQRRTNYWKRLADAESAHRERLYR